VAVLRSIAGRMAVMRAGEIVEEDASRDLLTMPRHE
jgi:ABC-type dipeptide/oligopeptide/nickel transport system ATPase component